MPRWPVKVVEEVEMDVSAFKQKVEEHKTEIAPKAIQLHHEYSFQDSDGVWFRYPAHLTFRRPETVRMLLEARCPYVEVE